MKKLLVLTLLLLVPALSVQFGILGRGDSRYLDTPTAAPERAPAKVRTNQGLGIVEPASEIRRLVFKAEGEIALCRAEAGRRYTKGEILMELDDRERQAAARVAEADWRLALAEREKVMSGAHPQQIEAASRAVEMLEEQVHYCKTEFDRANALSARSSISRSEFDRTRSALNRRKPELLRAEANLRYLRFLVRPEDRLHADARVNAAQARLDLARQQVEDIVLRAPFDGVVLEVLKREGEGSRLLDAEPVAVYGDPARLRVRSEFDERFVASLKTDQRVTVSGRGLGQREYRGRVAIVKPIMGKKTIFSRSSTERKDLDVIQVLVDIDGEFSAPIGLEVDVHIDCEESTGAIVRSAFRTVTTP
jgi:HlyD family secretion protein